MSSMNRVHRRGSLEDPDRRRFNSVLQLRANRVTRHKIHFLLEKLSQEVANANPLKQAQGFKIREKVDVAFGGSFVTGSGAEDGERFDSHRPELGAMSQNLRDQPVGCWHWRAPAHRWRITGTSICIVGLQNLHTSTTSAGEPGRAIPEE